MQVPPVKAYVLGWQNCLCHRPLTSKKRNEQLTEFQARSWRTFRHAASILQDDASKFLAKEGVDEASEPRDFFHRSCYQDYTNKTNLSRLEKEEITATSLLLERMTRLSMRSSMSPPKNDLLACPYSRQIWPAASFAKRKRRLPVINIRKKN